MRKSFISIFIAIMMILGQAQAAFGSMTSPEQVEGPNYLESNLHNSTNMDQGEKVSELVKPQSDDSREIAEGLNEEPSVTINTDFHTQDLNRSLAQTANATLIAKKTRDQVNSFDCETTNFPNPCIALVNIYNKTNGAGWTNNTGWLSSTDLAEWYGITIGQEIESFTPRPYPLDPIVVMRDVVKDVDLSDNNLIGTLTLSDLENLGLFRIAHIPLYPAVDLSNNDLSGVFSEEEGRAPILRGLDISGNQFSGVFSYWWQPFLARTLFSLDISNNNFSGIDWESLRRGGSELNKLNVSNNDMPGELPAQQGDFSFKEIDISNNRFTGTIPSWLGSNGELESFRIENNQLFGNLPESFSSNVGLCKQEQGSTECVPGANAGFSNNCLKVPQDHEPTDAFLNRIDPGWHLTQTTCPYPPIPKDDSYSILKGQSLTVAAPGVLENDFDQNYDPLTAVLTHRPNYGELQFNEDGSFVYTPEAGFSGYDYFMYKASDGNSLSQVIATVRIRVANPDVAPVGTDDYYKIPSYTITPPNSPPVLIIQDLNVGAPGVMRNDYDPSGTPITATLHTGPTNSNAVFSFNADGSFGYGMPNNVSWDGFEGDSFTYTISNGYHTSPPITVYIKKWTYESGIGLKPIPDATIPELESYTFNVETDYIQPPSGEYLTIELIGNPIGVTLVQEGSNAVVNWTPTEKQGPGEYTFGVSACKYVRKPFPYVKEFCEYERVFIKVEEVNNLPVAKDDHYITEQDVVLNIAAPGVLANDVDDSLSLTAILGTTTINGSLTLNADGGFSYVPNEGFVGFDSFTYTVSDGEHTSNQATVRIFVGNYEGEMVGRNDYYLLPAPNPTQGPLVVSAPGVLLNDTNTSPLPMVAELLSEPTKGTLVFNADGSFTYTSNNGERDSFTYKATTGYLETGALTVNIYPHDHDGGISLQAIPDATIPELEPYSFTAVTSYQYNHAYSLTFELIGIPIGATLEQEGSNAEFNWTPTEEQGPGVYPMLLRACMLTNLALPPEQSPEIYCEHEPVTLTVTEVNNLPVAKDDKYTTKQDVALNVAAPGVLENDEDDSPLLTVILGTTTANGSLTLNADGGFSYAPNEGFTGEDSFTYTVSDGEHTSNQATVRIFVGNYEGEMVGRNDYYLLPAPNPAQGPLVVSAPGVLLNDTNSSGVPMVAELLSEPTKGTLVFNADGSFTYTSNNGERDSFTYKATTGYLETSALSVNIYPHDHDGGIGLEPIPDATIPELEPYSFTVTTAFVPSNRYLLRFELINSPSGATLVNNGLTSAVFKWTPTEKQGPGVYPMLVRACQWSIRPHIREVYCEHEEFTITVTGLNQAPVAMDDKYTTKQDVVLNVAVPGVLANDVDDSPSLTATVVATTSHGSLVLNTDGGFIYTPNVGFTGVDSFTYTVSDGEHTSNTATVKLYVGDYDGELVARNDYYRIPYGQLFLELHAPGVLLNDTIVSAEPVIVVIDQEPTEGTVVLNPDGSFRYTSNALREDSFTYTVSNGYLESTAVVDIRKHDYETRIGLQTIPDATIPEMQPFGFTAKTTQTPPIPEMLKFEMLNGPEGSTLTQEGANAAFEWTPSEAQGPGVYTFIVRACRGVQLLGSPFVESYCEQEQVTLTVTDANADPVAVDDHYIAKSSEGVYIFEPGVLANDYNFNPETVHVVVVSGPVHGSLDLDLIPNGTMKYLITDGYVGSDSFTYKIVDGEKESNIATVHIESRVAGNTRPEIDPIANMTVYAGDQISFVVTGSDPDFPPQTLGYYSQNLPAGATVDLKTGLFLWQPNGRQIGVHPITMYVTDYDKSDSTNFTITVLAKIEAVAPVVTNDVYEVARDETLAVEEPGVLANDSDYNGDAITALLVSSTTNGTLTLEANGGFVYTPEVGFVGQDSFTYKASDGTLESENATVTINVIIPPVPPILSPIENATIREMEEYSFTAEATDENVEDTLTYTLVRAPEGATINSDTGVFTWTPSEAQGPGEYTFTVKVCDDATPALCAEQEVKLAVLEVDRPPVLEPIGQQTIEAGVKLELTLTASDPDVPVQQLYFYAENKPEGMTLFNFDGDIVWTPRADQIGDHSVRICVQTSPLQDCEVVTFTVIPMVTPVAPVAVDDRYTVLPGESLNVEAPGVLSNDYDFNANPLTAVLLEGTTNGELVFNTDGAFGYTPNPDFTGIDSFTYKANDGSWDSEVATVRIYVGKYDAPPIARNDFYIASTAGGSFTVNAPGILLNDTEPNGNPLVPILVGYDQEFEFNTDGSFTIDLPEGPNSRAYFTYQVTNGFMESEVAHVVIYGPDYTEGFTLDPIADAELPELSTHTFNASVTGYIPHEKMLLKYGLVNEPLGAVINEDTGAFTWTPAEEQGPGEYAFLVRACNVDNFDNYGEEWFCVQQVVTLTVTEINVAPVLSPIGAKNVEVSKVLSFNVVATDVDLPAQTLIYSANNLPEGAALDNNNGEFAWTPGVTQVGEHTVEFCVSDGELSDCETITITVSWLAQPTAPIAVNDSYAATAGEPLVVDAPGVMANDYDLNGDSLSAIRLSGPSHGELVFNEDGSFSYTARYDYEGTDSFRYMVNDGSHGSNLATVEITVTLGEGNHAPVLGQIEDATIPELEAYSFTATATDVDGDTLTYSLVGAPAGAVINAGSGKFEWTPTEVQGPAVYSFTVKVCDDGDPALCDEQEVKLTVTEVNVAPVIGYINDQNAVVGKELSFVVSASDADLPAQALTYSLVTPPSGASIDQQGVVKWTPTRLQGGERSLTIKVCDNQTPPLCATQVVKVVVRANEDDPIENTAPVLEAIDDQSVVVGTLVSFTAVGHDADVPAQTLSYSIEDAPADAMMNGATGAFSWTPEAVGIYTFRVKVCDSGEPVMCASQVVKVVVRAEGETETNTAPTLAEIADQSVEVGQEVSFTAVGSDSDVPVQTLRYSVEGAPVGATMNATTGAFSWTAGQAGVYTVVVVVCDDGDPALCARQSVKITVTAVVEENHAPVLGQIEDATIPEMVAYSFTAVATDADGDTLTFSMLSAPAGAVINASTGKFEWTPTEVQGPGVYTFTVKVCDDGEPEMCDDQEVTLTVTEMNQAPVIGYITDQNAVVGKELSFVVSASDADLPVQALTYSLVTPSSGASIEQNGTVKWTPEAAQIGTHEITVKVCDNQIPRLCATQVVKVVVRANEDDPIENTAPVLEAIDDQSVVVGNEVRFTAVGHDADVPAQTLVYSIEDAPAGATIDATSGAFSWTPGVIGTYTIRVKVCDNGEPVMCASAPVKIVVKAEGETDTNTAPTLAEIADQSVEVGQEVSFTAVGSDSDVPAQTLRYSIEGAPVGATMNATTGLFSWTAGQAGEYHVVVVVCDDGDPVLCARQSVKISVTAAIVENHAPVLGLIEDATIPEMVAYSFTAVATDVDAGDTLTYSLVGAPEGASIDAASGVFTWTPTESQGPEEYSFTVKVCDDGNPIMCDEQELTLNVTEVNLPPVLAEIGDRTVVVGEELTFTAEATDEDIPAQTLTFSLKNAPTGAEITADTGIFNWTPTIAQVGSHIFEVCVTDGVAEVCEEITVTVEEPAVINEPPVAANDTYTTAEDVALTVAAPGVLANDSDPNGDAITAELVTSPSHGTLTLAANGGFVYTPNADWHGSDSFTYKAKDAELYSNVATVTITVTPVNDAPVLNPIPDATIPEMVAYTFTATATDVDSTNLTFSLVGAPAGAAINASTGVFTWTPTEAQGPQAYTFTVKVCDDATPVACDQQSVKLTVTEVNLAPEIEAIEDQEVTAGEELTFTAVAIDPDLPANTLTFRLEEAPIGAAIDATTGKFTWTPVESQIGVHEFQVCVTDGLLNACTPVKVTVLSGHVNTPPVAVADTYAVDQDKVLTIAAPGVLANDTDADNDTLTAILVGTTSNGTLTLNADGSFVYTPRDGYYGTDTFTYKANDGEADSNVVTVTITVKKVEPVFPYGMYFPVIVKGH